jgi:hypothetical protein
VSVATDPNFELGKSTLLFDMPVTFDVAFASQSAVGPFDVAPDGARFLVLSPLSLLASAPLTVTINWTSALKNRN